MRIALSGVIGALTHALDITEGQPAGHARRSCAIGMRVAEAIGLEEGPASDLFYALLLKDAGCTANAAQMAALFGADDQEIKRTSKLVDWSKPAAAMRWSLGVVAPGRSLRRRADRLRAIKAEGEVTHKVMRARCERGAEIALMLGLTPMTAAAIRTLDEHWDGHGQPDGLAGDEIPVLGRILCLAQTVEIFHAARGVDAAYAMADDRRGTWFDPALVEALESFRGDGAFWGGLAEPDVSRWEPDDRALTVGEDGLDRIAAAFARVIDAKSPWTYRHSERVSLVAVGVGSELGFGERQLRELRRAALMHDIGKLAVSNRILDKPDRLSEPELAAVRLHPLHSQRILERAPGFAELAPIAAAHHERLDGGGYPFGLGAEQLTLPMRVLAAADVFEALTAPRPYRPAMALDQALATLRQDVPERLDAEVVAALETVLERGAIPEAG